MGRFEILRYISDDQMLIQMILPLLGVLLLTVVIARWTYGRQKKPSLSSLPPGNLGVPILGETLQYLASKSSCSPWDFYNERQTRHGPVYKTSIFGRTTVLLDAPSGNQFLFSNHGKLVITAWPSQFRELFGSNALFFLQGLDAKRLRRIFMAFLGPDAMQTYVGRMSKIFEEHVKDCWVGREQVKAYVLVKEALFTNICSLFFSIEDKQLQQKLLAPFTDIFFGMLALPIDLPWTAYHRAKRGRKLIIQELDDIIRLRRMELQEKKASERQDLLSVLLTTADEDSGKLMSDEEIKDNVIMLLVSGHDTTAVAVSMAIKLLAQNPESYQLVLQENMEIASKKHLNSPLSWSDVRQMRYTWKVLQETMRLYPPAQGAFRTAVRNFQTSGYEIIKGWQLLLAMHNSHRKEKFFPEPQKFDPNRFEGTGPIPYTYVPFGGGPRICPGIELAKTQALVFLHHLILSVQWSLVNPQEEIIWHPFPRPRNGLGLYILSKF